MNPLNKTTSWILWVVLLLPFLYLMNYTMPGVQTAIGDVADKPECAESPDLYFGVSSQKAYQSLDCMGKNGRAVYQKESIVKDSVYPVSYGLFFAFTLFLLSSSLFRKKWPVITLTVLPLAASCFDFLENYQIRRLIDQFPALQQNTVHIASLANMGKWSFINISMVAMVILVVMVFARMIRGK